MKIGGFFAQPRIKNNLLRAGNHDRPPEISNAWCAVGMNVHEDSQHIIRYFRDCRVLYITYSFLGSLTRGQTAKNCKLQNCIYTKLLLGFCCWHQVMRFVLVCLCVGVVFSSCLHVLFSFCLLARLLACLLACSLACLLACLLAYLLACWHDIGLGGRFGGEAPMR